LPGLHHPRGRRQIRITEWGPYDFRSPILWRTNPLDTSGLLKFDVLGPKGNWQLKNSRGVDGISKTSGQFADSITARRLPGHRGDIFIELEYVGEQVTTQFGQVVPQGKPFNFAFRDARVPIKWEAKWFAWDPATNPVVRPENWETLVAGQPVLQETGKPLDYAWWGGISVQGKKVEKFLTQAEASVDVLPGDYELGVTWDDAVRVYLDGRLIINEWNPSLYKFDESPHRKVKLKLNGVHRLRVEHVELGGFATLSIKLKKI
jgi:PA14 domain